MKLWKLTKKQVIIRLAVLIVLLAGVYVFLLLRAARHWKPAAVTEQISAPRSNPYLNPEGMTQETRILPPEGYTRVPAGEDSLLTYLRRMPVYPECSALYVYDGTTRPGSNAAAVYTLSVGSEGYQECADTVIRLWSDYFNATGQRDRLRFHLTNGFLCDYDSFRRGRRVFAVGSFSAWLPLTGADDSPQTYHDWLMTVMHYAGTLSLERETAPISPADAHAGDILCRGGSPGHAVLLCDEAVNAEGQRCYLLVQGMIPAQSAHILFAGDDPDNPWITQEALGNYPVRAGAYTFDENMLRRYGDGFPAQP